MKIEIPAFTPLLRANEHLAHGPISIDLGEDLVLVIRCKNCGYYRNKNQVCIGLPTESMVFRNPEDFCSKAVRKKEE